MRRVAATLSANLRETDTVARIGGDEFAVLLPETDAADADTVLRYTRRTVVSAMRRERYPVTLSMGVATFRDPPETVDEILRLADGLMYRAKRSGKDRIESNREVILSGR